MMDTKKILALMVEAGNGHKSPAMAINDAIEREYPGMFSLKMLDAFKDTGCLNLDAFYKETWRHILSLPVSMTRVGYIAWQSRFLTHFSERSVGIFFKERLAEMIEREKPDLIYSTYFVTTHFLSVLKKQGRITVPVVAVNTDPFNVHAAWIYHTVDRYIVFSGKVREIVEQKCDCSEVAVFQYPLRPGFAKSSVGQDELRMKLGMRLSVPTLLMTSGGEGVGALEKYIQTVIGNNLPIQMVVVCGRNESMQRELEAIRIPGDSACSLKVLGFVTNMAELMAASDMVLGKAGASTTFETLVSGRPIIHSSYLPNEQGTMEFVTENGFGWYAPDRASFEPLITRIAQNPAILDEVKGRLNAWGFKNGSADIARYIVQTCLEHPACGEKPDTGRRFSPEAIRNLFGKKRRRTEGLLP